MREIEIKILDINVKKIKAKLKKIGAHKKFSSNVEMIIFDFPDQRLNNSGFVLRVRKIDGKTELCFKGKKEDSKFKIREEIEVNTNNFENTIKIIKNLGLKNVYSGTKHREEYMLGKVKFEIDTIDNIPPFIEIEAPTEEDIEETVHKLDYTMGQTTNLSTKEIKRLYEHELAQNF